LEWVTAPSLDLLPLFCPAPCSKILDALRVEDGSLGFTNPDPLSKNHWKLPLFRFLTRTQWTRWVCALYVPSALAVCCTLVTNSL